MTESDGKIAEALLDALMLNWEDNGNICADAVRDTWMQALSEVFEIGFNEIESMIEERINNKQ